MGEDSRISVPHSTLLVIPVFYAGATCCSRHVAHDRKGDYYGRSME